MPPPAPSPAGPTLWRASPPRLARLVAGLWLFGTGEGLVVLAGLGNSPWTVFADGVSTRTPLSIGAATIATSMVILLLWTRLAVRPGLGTILNAVLIGVAIDATLSLLDEPSEPVVRVLALLGGIALVGAGSGLYLGCRLGPGPRDGLMLGLHARTGRPIAALRTGIELSAFAAGVALGGTAGVGTLTFALLVGPAVATGVQLLPGRGPAPDPDVVRAAASA